MDVATGQSLWEDAECCEVTGLAGKLALRKVDLFACARAGGPKRHLQVLAFDSRCSRHHFQNHLSRSISR
jgi:hypothetical protein